MGLVKSGNIGGSSGGGVNYELYADQTGASGNSRTIRVTLKLKLAGNPSYPSYYGYPAQWQGIVNGAYSGWMGVKGTETWKTTDNWRSYAWTYTTDVGTTSSKSISVGFQLDSYSGDNTWDTTQTGSFSVGSTNTAPRMNGSVTIRNGSSSGAVLSGIIPENTATLYLSWSAGSDNEQGSNGLKYGVNEIVNDRGATTIVYPTTNTFTTRSIGTGAVNEGETRRYYVDCRDNSDALSSNRADSVQITKNTLTPANFTGHSNNILFDTQAFSVYYGGAKNADNSPCTFLLFSNTVTIYNGTASATGTQEVKIWRGGTAPTTPYISFDELKSKVSGSDYVGNIHIGVRTINNYENSKETNGAISVDLRTNPNPVTKQEISANATESLIYKKVAFANNYYFLPDGKQGLRVKWATGSGKLGEPVSYEIFVAYGSESWQKIADITDSSKTYYDHIIPKQTVSQTVKYMIRTKASYGYQSDAVTPAQTLHYYNAPSITIGPISRTDTTAEIPITIKSLSSIPGILTVGTWSGQGTGNLSSSQAEQKITVTGLTGDGTYSINVVYNDNTGFSQNDTKPIAIGANKPIMFLNKYGLAVGGSKADANASLLVSGNALVNGYLKSNLSGNVLTIGSKNSSYCHFENSANIPFWFNRDVRVQGEIYAGPNYDQRVYHTGYKPSAQDLNALLLSGGTMTGQITTPTGGALKDAGGNIFLRSNNGGATVLSVNNGTIYLRPKGDLDSSVQAAFDASGNLSGIKKINGLSVGFDANNVNPKNSIAVIKSDGVLEVSRYIDFHDTDSAQDYSHRLHSNGDGIQIHRGAGGNSNWAGFYRQDGYRYGYIGNGSNSNEYFYVSAGNAQGLMLASDTDYIYTIGNIVPSYTRKYWLGTNSPNYQWKGVCCEGGTVGASDARQKENIIRLDGTAVMVNRAGVLSETKTFNRGFSKAKSIDYYDFMRDRFKPTYFDYKIDESEIDLGEHYPEGVAPKQRKRVRSMAVEEERKLLKNVGFLAQDYNLRVDKVAREFIIENRDGSLLYNHMSYVTVGMIALQEAIKKIEQLEERIKKLENQA